MLNSEVLINPKETLFRALEILQIKSIKCLIVVNNKNRLLGTINDGDIRRAILKGSNIKSTIVNTYKKKCYYIVKTAKTIDENRIFKKAKLEIELIPVVDRKKIVLSYLSKNKKETNRKKSKFNNIKIIIMAGGLGTRLKPYTNIIPKPLLPYNGNTIIESVIETFTKFGFNKFLVSLNYKNILMKSFFQELKPNYDVSFLQEKKPLGTAGILRKLYSKNNKKYLVTNCDTILDADYEDLINYHNKSKNDLTIAASTKKNKIPYGVCYIHNNKLKKIDEKPENFYLANVGVYLVSSNVLNLIAKNKPTSFVDFINKLLLKKKKIGIFPIAEKSWTDLGQTVEFIDRN